MSKKVAIRKAWADMDGNVQEGYDQSRAYEQNQYESSSNPNRNPNPFKGTHDDMQPCPVCNGTGMITQRPQGGANPYQANPYRANPYQTNPSDIRVNEPYQEKLPSKPPSPYEKHKPYPYSHPSTWVNTGKDRRAFL